MTSTLALLGFLALIFLLVYRGLIACERRHHRIHQQRRHRHVASRKLLQEQAEISREESGTLLSVKQV